MTSPSAILEASLRRAVQRLGRLVRPAAKEDPRYAERLREEQAIYGDCVDVNDLPAIFHYWSNRYLRPKLAAFGFENPDEFFALHLAKAAASRPGERARFVSVGAGNCDTEVRVASLLRSRGLEAFTIECLDLNAAMLERGRALAAEAGVAEHIVATEADFNQWQPDRPYDAVMANQSLHHVVELEHLFDAIATALRPGALFMCSDMVGRNGHQRWPEALAIVRELWRELPAEYRYNRQLQRHEEEFMDWDCSGEGFEGIRAQDILPLLTARFEFDLFIPFANVIDPFIDRGFGHHFRVEQEWDRGFIDRVHARDEAQIAAGRITPTHAMAVMCRGRKGEARFCGGLSPRRCIRMP
jgi:SAM-dependent methyltransferase